MEGDNFAAQYVRVGDSSKFRQGHDFHGPVTIVNKGKVRSNQTKSINDLPDLLSSNFIGRSHELNQINDALDTVHGDAPSRCIVYGMPGLGKTQLALKFSEGAYKELRYQFVFWISAASAEKLSQGFSKLAHLLSLPERLSLDQSAKHTAARAWLEDSESQVERKWLLVLDNVNQETAVHVREIVPRKNSNGSILMTTRTEHVAESMAEAFGERHPCIGLRAPDIDDAVTLLLRAARFREESQETTEFLEAKQLVKSIGCLPLAVDQAASFIRESGNSINEVLKIYKSELAGNALSWKNDLSRYEESSVTATFTSAFEELERTSPETANLLRILAFLDPESISIDMLKEGCTGLSMIEPVSSKSALPLILQKLKTQVTRRSSKPENINQMSRGAAINTLDELQGVRRLLHTPVNLQTTIKHLTKLSLVVQQKDGETVTLWLHDLVQLLIQTKLVKESERKKWLQYTINITCKAFKMIGDYFLPENWPRCEKFVAHMQILHKHTETYKVENTELLETHSMIALHFVASGRDSEAEKLLKQTLAKQREIFGAEHPDTLFSMHGLAIKLVSLYRLAEAEELMKQVLEGRERLFGRKHRVTLASMTTLALIYNEQGRWAEAERLGMQALNLKKSVLGLEHRDTLITMNDLVSTYRNQGRRLEAEELVLQVVDLSKRVLGEEDMDTLCAMCNLATIYGGQRRLSEAEELYIQVTAIGKRVLGKEHPNTLLYMSRLALTYRCQGRLSEAEELYIQIIKIGKRVLGKEHPDTLIYMSNLALTYRDHGRLSEAEELFMQVLSVAKRVPGKDHPQTLDRMEHLAEIYQRQGRNDEAIVLLKRLIDLRTRTIGANHPDTIRAINKLRAWQHNEATRQQLCGHQEES